MDIMVRFAIWVGGKGIILQTQALEDAFIKNWPPLIYTASMAFGNCHLSKCKWTHLAELAEGIWDVAFVLRHR